MNTVTDAEGREIEIIQVEAVASLASVNAFGSERATTAEVIQRAMTAAVQFAYSKGITDPEKIKELMLAARERIKRELATGQEDRGA